MAKIRLGEPMFRSIQGEGIHTGKLSIWVRFFGCNLNCSGFMQPNPIDPSTYILPQFDSTPTVKCVTDLPVFERGCDSGYSWNHLYKKLAIDYPNATSLVDDMQKFLYNNETWTHPVTKNGIDLCFTGGEPMMHQNSMIDIVNNIVSRNKFNERNLPGNIQIETNGTKPLKREFIDWYSSGMFSVRLNISPKLFNVSGEKEALNLGVIKQYHDEITYGIGCLKFVVNDRDETWDELNTFVKQLRDSYIGYPIFVMPCGGTKEQQEDTNVIAKIANRAIAEGYHVSGRLHCNIFGNTAGT